MSEKETRDFTCKFFIRDFIGDRGLPASKSWMLIGVLWPKAGGGCRSILCGTCVLPLNWRTRSFLIRMKLH